MLSSITDICMGSGDSADVHEVRGDSGLVGGVAWAGQEAQAAEPADASGRTMKGRLRSQQRKEKRLGAVDAHLPKHDGQRRER